MKNIKEYNVVLLGIALLLIAILSLKSAMDIKNLKVENENLNKKVNELMTENHFTKLEGKYESR